MILNFPPNFAANRKKNFAAKHPLIWRIHGPNLVRFRENPSADYLNTLRIVGVKSINSWDNLEKFTMMKIIFRILDGVWDAR